jgi:hypothetical protein
MNTQKTNHQNKIKLDAYIPNFSFLWVYTSNGLDSQGHDEEKYENFISSNYRSVSNKYL